MANKNHDVKVTFAKGTVKFSPNRGKVTVGKGADDSIIFAGTSSFRFTKIRFRPAGPFTTSVQDDRIVVIDRNRNASGNYKDYKYYITVKPNTSSEVESLDPRIRNISF